VSMKAIIGAVARLVGDDEGQDLIEYALLAGLIALVAVVGVTAVGNAVNNVLWQTIATAL
jgi:Flp pilus assembly pilin Flp